MFVMRPLPLPWGSIQAAVRGTVISSTAPGPELSFWQAFRGRRRLQGEMWFDIDERQFEALNPLLRSRGSYGSVSQRRISYSSFDSPIPPGKRVAITFRMATEVEVFLGAPSGVIWSVVPITDETAPIEHEVDGAVPQLQLVS